MSRLVRISSAAVGMAMLAALATYQGHVDLGEGQEDVLTGTAMAESHESEAGRENRLPCGASGQTSDSLELADGATSVSNGIDCDAIASAER